MDITETTTPALIMAALLAEVEARECTLAAAERIASVCELVMRRIVADLEQVPA